MKTYNNFLNNKTILITGGTGSISQFIIEFLLKKTKTKKIIIFSRDEYKQYQLKLNYEKYSNKFEFIIGDIRDMNSLIKATKNVDYLIHTAALKHVDVCEKNPEETIKTNINGSQNVIDACIANKVKKVVSLSTDKASMPINLYGASKLASDKLFIAANLNSTYSKFSVVRYGNVFSSRGSVYPYYKKLINSNIKELPLTDLKMTRFWITPNEAIKSIFITFNQMYGGEIFVPKIRAFKVIDLIKALNCDYRIIGMRNGEKLHETLICKDDSKYTVDANDFYIITPPFQSIKSKKYYKKYKKVSSDFEYLSNISKNFIGKIKIREFINKND